jgi:hypothetical protein
LARAICDIPILSKEYIENARIHDALRDYNASRARNERLRDNGIDKYYHSRAMYQAAQLGPTAKSLALWGGRRKEDLDYFKKVYLQNQPKDQVLKDSEEDLQFNEESAKLGLGNSTDVNSVYTVPPTVSVLQQILRGKK